MKKPLLLTFTILSFQILSQNFQWVKELGYGNSQTSSEAITIDSNGSIYTTGSFQGTADFDPGPGTYNLTLNATGINTDIFISKLDFMGNFVWVKSIGGINASANNSDLAASICTDSQGNVYVTGQFRATVDFDPGSGIQLVTAAGVNDIFILKLDPSGNYIWVRTFGDTGIDYGTAISTDSFGNIYTTGNFNGTIDFDPSSGVSNISSFNDDLFILKLDPSGSLVWIKNMGGSISQCSPSSIHLDSFGNIYTTGNFYGSVDFDPNMATFTLTANASSIFISKLNAQGDFIWAKSMGSTTQNSGGQSIETDQLGNVYTTGYFQGVADFDPNIGTYTYTAGGSNAFVSKLDVNGNFVWAKSIGQTWSDDCQASSIKIDPFGFLYSTGFFHGYIDFDPGISTTILNANGHSVYVLKLDTAGNFISVKDINTNGYSSGNGLTLNSQGDVLATGTFDRLIDFNNNLGIDTLTTIGFQTHSFIVKYSDISSGINQIQVYLSDQINIFPNPNSGQFNVKSKDNMSLSLINNLGQIVETIELNEVNGYQQTIQINTSGIYYINGVTEQSTVKQKIIVTH